MSARRIAAIAAAGIVVAGGSGAAIAAVTTNHDPKKDEQELLDNAAKRLDVTPQKLRDALSAARDDQLAEAVKNGDLTQKQADAIKQRREQSGTVLGPGGPGGPGGRGPGPWLHGMHHGGPGFGLFSDLAKALGLSDEKLMSKLRDGKSIAAVAKAQGKSLDDVRSAVKAAAKTRTDKAVDDGDLTRKQADALLAHLDRRLANLYKAPRLRFHGHHGFGDGPPPPDADAEPGSFRPPPDGPPPPAGAPSTF